LIFLTVGTQLPFDRLVKALDSVVMELPNKVDVFAQISNTSYIPKNFDSSPYLTPEKFLQYFERSEIIISHAGMGSILQSLTAGKNIIVMPRLASLSEHRNDHQLTSCEKLKSLDGLVIVNNEYELKYAITKGKNRIGLNNLSPYASRGLLDFIEGEINSK
jgi:UDP-N-acetylglucosamine transferase subunit ALG13